MQVFVFMSSGRAVGSTSVENKLYFYTASLLCMGQSDNRLVVGREPFLRKEYVPLEYEMSKPLSPLSQLRQTQAQKIALRYDL